MFAVLVHNQTIYEENVSFKFKKVLDDHAIADEFKQPFIPFVDKDCDIFLLFINQLMQGDGIEKLLEAVNHVNVGANASSKYEKPVPFYLPQKVANASESIPWIGIGRR